MSTKAKTFFSLNLKPVTLLSILFLRLLHNNGTVTSVAIRPEIVLDTNSTRAKQFQGSQSTKKEILVPNKGDLIMTTWEACNALISVKNAVTNRESITFDLHSTGKFYVTGEKNDRNFV